MEIGAELDREIATLGMFESSNGSCKTKSENSTRDLNFGGKERDGCHVLKSRHLKMESAFPVLILWDLDSL